MKKQLLFTLALTSTFATSWSASTEKQFSIQCGDDKQVTVSQKTINHINVFKNMLDYCSDSDNNKIPCPFISSKSMTGIKLLMENRLLCNNLIITNPMYITSNPSHWESYFKDFTLQDWIQLKNNYDALDIDESTCTPQTICHAAEEQDVPPTINYGDPASVYAALISPTHFMNTKIQSLILNNTFAEKFLNQNAEEHACINSLDPMGHGCGTYPFKKFFMEHLSKSATPPHYPVRIFSTNNDFNKELTISDDGSMIASETNTAMHIFDLLNRNFTQKSVHLDAEILSDAKNFNDAPLFKSLLLTPDGKKLGKCLNNKVIIFDTMNDQKTTPIHRIITESSITAFAFTPDSKKLVAGIKRVFIDDKIVDGGVHIFDINTDTLDITTPAHIITPEAEISAVAVSPDNRLLASCDTANVLTITDLNKLTNSNKLTDIPNSYNLNLPNFLGGINPVQALLFTPDNKKLVIVSADRNLVYDVIDTFLLNEMRIPSWNYLNNTYYFSHDSHYLIYRNTEANFPIAQSNALYPQPEGKPRYDDTHPAIFAGMGTNTMAFNKDHSIIATIDPHNINQINVFSRFSKIALALRGYNSITEPTNRFPLNPLYTLYCLSIFNNKELLNNNETINEILGSLPPQIMKSLEGLYNYESRYHGDPHRAPNDFIHHLQQAYTQICTKQLEQQQFQEQRALQAQSAERRKLGQLTLNNQK